MARNKREQLHAGRQVADELVEALERRIGVGLLGDRLEQPRHQLGQQLARSRIAGRANVAVVPGAHPRRDRLGLSEAHLGEGGEGVRIVIGAGEHQGAAAAQIDAGLEQRGVVRLDPLEVAPHGVGQARRIRIAHEGREPLELLGAGGQAVGLFVADHLQAVLGATQEAIGFDQLVGDGAFEPAGIDQGAQRGTGAGRPQLGQAATQDQLLGLDEELDLANAAAPHLEIVAGHPDLAVAPIGVDLPLDRVDVADRGVVQVLAPEKRLECAQEAFARRAISGDHAGLDQGRALPVLAVPFVVLLGVLDRQGERMPRRVRPQAQIGAEHVAIARAVLEDVGQRAGQAHRKRHRALPAAIAEPVRIEQDDQIDVAGVVELERAELAHAEHDQTRFVLRPVLLSEFDLAALRRLAQDQVHGLLGREIGKAAQHLRRPLERPQAGDVRQRRQQGHAALGAAQVAHELGAVSGRLGGMLGEQRVERGIGPDLQHPSEDGRLAQQQLAQIGAVAEDAREQALQIDGPRAARRRVGQARPAREPALGGGGIADPRQSVRDLIGDLNHIPPLADLGQTVESPPAECAIDPPRLEAPAARPAPSGRAGVAGAGLVRLAAADRAGLGRLADTLPRARAQHRPPDRRHRQTELRLGEDHSLDLRAVGVHVRDPNGRLLGELPEVEIGLSTSALLFERRIAVRRIDAVAPSPDAHPACRMAASACMSSPMSPKPTPSTSARCSPISSPNRKHAEHPSHLEHIRFSGGELILQDQTRGRTLRARDAELNDRFPRRSGCRGSEIRDRSGGATGCCFTSQQRMSRIRTG